MGIELFLYVYKITWDNGYFYTNVLEINYYNGYCTKIILEISYYNGNVKI